MDNIDWKNLPFGYVRTDYNVRCFYRNGKWGELEISSSEFMNVHIAATGLHYGQEAFEGMKAYRGMDKRVRIFRWEENARRLLSSANGVLMAQVPEELFKKAVMTVVKMNERFVPPHGSGATLYIRPLLFGSGAEVGVKPANEYAFVVFVSPVGPYFKGGVKPVNMLICREYDRAAPLGTGNIKVGGNYAASLRAIIKARDEGYANFLFLDARDKKFIDECGPANFFGIKGNVYVTPRSESILPSITNMSLMTIASDLGLKVERRPVPVEELAEFDETGACGTAAVISPICRIDDPGSGKSYQYCRDGNPGPWTMKLYETLTGIQYGDIEDRYGWITFVD